MNDFFQGPPIITQRAGTLDLRKRSFNNIYYKFSLGQFFKWNLENFFLHILKIYAALSCSDLLIFSHKNSEIEMCLYF